jgi:hypothetical protein
MQIKDCLCFFIKLLHHPVYLLDETGIYDHQGYCMDNVKTAVEWKYYDNFEHSIRVFNGTKKNMV